MGISISSGITLFLLPDDPHNGKLFQRTLEREAKNASKLIIWTDCDREGENIGFEIIKVCQAVKPSLQVQRWVHFEWRLSVKLRIDRIDRKRVDVLVTCHFILKRLVIGSSYHWVISTTDPLVLRTFQHWIIFFHKTSHPKGLSSSDIFVTTVWEV